MNMTNILYTYTLILTTFGSDQSLKLIKFLCTIDLVMRIIIV